MTQTSGGLWLKAFFLTSTLLVTALVPGRVNSTPPPPAPERLFFVLLEGQHSGLPLGYPYEDRRSQTITIPLSSNPGIRAEGTVTRHPGEAQSAFFSGRVGRTRLDRVAALKLGRQPHGLANTAFAIDRLLTAKNRVTSSPAVAGRLLGWASYALRWAVSYAVWTPEAMRPTLLDRLRTAQDRTWEAERTMARLAKKHSGPLKTEARKNIEVARKAAQAAFAVFAVIEVNPGFDVEIYDDKSPNLDLSWNTVTGRYVGYCNYYIEGKADVTATPNGFRLSDETEAYRIEAEVNTDTHSGQATLQVPAGDAHCTITDLDYTLPP